MAAPLQRPFDTIEGVRRATHALLTTVDDLSDVQAQRGSLVPDWTRGEVVTHLARNADGLRGMAEAVEQGTTGMQYPGGADQRRDDIAKGRDTNAAALRMDLRRSCDALMEVWSRLPDDAWSHEGSTLNGPRTIAGTAWSRWREIEIHHFDLDLGYAPSDWPVVFVRRALDERLGDIGNAPPDAAIGSGALSVRLDASDLERSWVIRVRQHATEVAEHALDSHDDEEPDAVVHGWGCDLLAWLYGRDPRAVELTFTGAAALLELPEWFPYG